MTRDEQIASLKRAMVRAQTEDDKRFPFSAGDGCCPSCMYGREYREAMASQQRRADWFVVLLRKRGTVADLRTAHAVEISAWP
jgi:hypothetical protein